VESFNGKLRGELLNGEIFHTVHQAKVLIEQWRRQYNTIRPHSSLGYRPPVPEAMGIPPRGAAAWPPSAALRPARQPGEKHRVL
jgi:putative transposase